MKGELLQLSTKNYATPSHPSADKREINGVKSKKLI